MCDVSRQAQVFLDDALALLRASQSRTGWVGPARSAFDAITEEFQGRLVVLSLRLHTIG